MKFILILILVHTIILTTVVKAQKNFSLSKRKPVVDLKTEIMKATRQKPEERRKSSIFPKNTQKFVVTSPPYSKVRTYTPRPIFLTKKTFMPVYYPSTTTNEPVPIKDFNTSFESVRDWPPKVSESKSHGRIIGEKLLNNRRGFNQGKNLVKENLLEFSTPRRINEENHLNNRKSYKINQDNNFEKENQIKDDSEEISTGLPEFAEELNNDVANNVLVDFNALSELDNARVKRFAVHSPVSVHDSWYFKNVARVPNTEDDDDEDEFIFINNKTKVIPSDILSVDKSSRSINIEKTSPSTSHVSPRLKRSENVIEEEPRVTPVSRTHSIVREPRVNSDVVFNNIHA